MARKPQENPQLDMTPMIDVVFELIIFFVVTIKQQDILSKLNINRPAPADSSAPSEKDDENVKIQVADDGISYGINDQRLEMKQVDEYLDGIAKKAAKPEETPIVISCAKNSPHRALVKVLDCCYKHKLYSISVFSVVKED